MIQKISPIIRRCYSIADMEHEILAYAKDNDIIIDAIDTTSVNGEPAILVEYCEHSIIDGVERKTIYPNYYLLSE